ncbi:uncharacterized protein PAC_16266 [Phialocephala subalpina]|uniref:Uncharacterized protein n=1 Tax=Phialocephala subalpina TaxID=576137 RepID=A0A1L7XMT8_9HELO|nr:uncharacterized protein PAC_16266 [Phialocephala subalpina]
MAFGPFMPPPRQETSKSLYSTFIAKLTEDPRSAISSEFEDHSLESFLEHNLTSYVCPAELGAASNNDSYVAFSNIFASGYEDLETLYPLSFRYEYSNYLDSITDLSALPTNPSLATPSQLSQYHDIPPTVPSAILQPQGHYSQPGTSLQLPGLSPPSLSHSPQEPSLLPRAPVQASSFELYNPKTSCDSTVENTRILMHHQLVHQHLGYQDNTVTSQQHIIPELPQDQPQQQLSTTSRLTSQSSGDSIVPSPNPGLFAQIPPQQIPARSRRKHDRQLKCTSCSKVFLRRCDLNLELSLIQKLSLTQAEVNTARATSAHSSVTSPVATIPKDLRYKKISAVISIPFTARAPSLVTFQVVEKRFRAFSVTTASNNPSSNRLQSRTPSPSPTIRSSTFGMESTIWRSPKRARHIMYWLQSPYSIYRNAGKSGSGKTTFMKYLYNDSSTNIGSALVAWTETFYAKEELRFDITYSSSDKLPSLPRHKMIANETNLGPGDPETIWNSMASHLPQGEPLFRCTSRFSFTPTQKQSRESRFLQSFCRSYRMKIRYEVRNEPEVDEHGRSSKGWDEEWGSFWVPIFHSRIGQLFDRDHVWAVTQTMVSLETLALWAMHNVYAFKVYPGFWGRLLLGSS